jgi:hypothetical protein
VVSGGRATASGPPGVGQPSADRAQNAPFWQRQPGAAGGAKRDARAGVKWFSGFFSIGSIPEEARHKWSHLPRREPADKTKTALTSRPYAREQNALDAAIPVCQCSPGSRGNNAPKQVLASPSKANTPRPAASTVDEAVRCPSPVGWLPQGPPRSQRRSGDAQAASG